MNCTILENRQGYDAEIKMNYDNNFFNFFEGNGTMSGSKRIKHVNTRHVHINDVIENIDLTLKLGYCSAYDMIRD